jgi:hypothetical protein
MARHYDHKTLAAIVLIFALPSLQAQIEAACALGAPAAHSDIRELFHRKRDDKRTAMSRADCKFEGGWGDTSQIEKEKSGALRSFLDGKKRLISTASFYEHLITRLILSHPADGPAPRGTATSTRFGARRAVDVREGSGAA